jgi:hypothetical protein
MIPSKSRGIPVLQITTEAYRSLTVFRPIREQIHHDAVTTVKLHEVEAAESGGVPILTASRQACIDTVNPLPVGASTLAY